VSFKDQRAGETAISTLNGKSVDLDAPFAIENAAELEIWRQWSGQLTVVWTEPPRLVPSSVEEFFPDLPDWAIGAKDSRGDETDTMEVEVQIKQERDSSPESLVRKRERSRNTSEPAKQGDKSQVSSSVVVQS
jgi:hypothetical protein